MGRASEIGDRPRLARTKSYDPEVLGYIMFLVSWPYQQLQQKKWHEKSGRGATRGSIEEALSYSMLMTVSVSFRLSSKKRQKFHRRIAEVMSWYI